MAHGNRDPLVFDEQGQLIGMTGETPEHPKSRRFAKDPNATTFDETYVAGPYGRGQFVWRKRISTRTATAWILAILFILGLVAWKSIKDSERMLSAYRAEIAERTQRGCKQPLPGISRDDGEDPDKGCAPKKPKP